MCRDFPLASETHSPPCSPHSVPQEADLGSICDGSLALGTGGLEVSGVGYLFLRLLPVSRFLPTVTHPTVLQRPVVETVSTVVF